MFSQPLVFSVGETNHFDGEVVKVEARASF